MRGKTVSTDFPKTFRMHDKLFVGLSGLATDVQTVSEKLKFRINMYKLKEERDIKASTFTKMLSNMLYEKRFGPYFVGPIVAGLEGKENKPYIAGMDLIGATEEPKDFIAQGTCAENLVGMCETLYKPDMVRLNCPHCSYYPCDSTHSFHCRIPMSCLRPSPSAFCQPSIGMP